MRQILSNEKETKLRTEKLKDMRGYWGAGYGISFVNLFL